MRFGKFFLFFLVLFLISFIAGQECNSLGYINGTHYCSEEGIYELLKLDGEVCANNYECANYECVDGLCQSKFVNVTLNLTEQIGLFEGIFNFIQGIECNPLNQSYYCVEGEAFLCGTNGVWESKGEVPGECEIPFYTCGDGITEEGHEQCDDGNDIMEDSCKNDCTINICGDTVMNIGVEECDDGANGVTGDGCTDECLIENCEPGEVGSYSCIGFYNSTCGDDLVWHPINQTIGECGVECLPLGNESCEGSILSVCNESYVWQNLGIIDGKCGYNPPTGSRRSGGSSRPRIRIIIYSPLEGITYGNTIIPLQVEDYYDNAQYWFYSLNGAKKISFTPNISITVAVEGDNILIIYARDRFNTRYEKTETVNFNVLLPPPIQPGYCGDGICKDDEDCENCALDCGECITEQVLEGLEVCGDGICESTESSYSCPSDCPALERRDYTYVAAGAVAVSLGALAFFLYKKFFAETISVGAKLIDPRAAQALKS